jgi:hypothetical protein
MTDDPQYPTIQWSCFSKDKLEQVVIRAEDEVNADALIAWAKTKLSQPAFPNDSGPSVTPPDRGITPAPICGIHHVVMTLRPAGVSKVGRPYPAFYACPEIDANGVYCNYHPPKKG